MTVAYVEVVPRWHEPDPPLEAVWERRGAAPVVGPGWNALADALDWARVRAPAVVVSFTEVVAARTTLWVERGRFSFRAPLMIARRDFSAGATVVEDLPVLHAPASADETAPLVPGHGGQVVITSRGDEFDALPDSAAPAVAWCEHERVRTGEIVEMPLTDAVAWATDRAETTFVCPDAYLSEYFFLGDVIPGLDMPRWRRDLQEMGRQFPLSDSTLSAIAQRATVARSTPNLLFEK